MRWKSVICVLLVLLLCFPSITLAPQRKQSEEEPVWDARVTYVEERKPYAHGRVSGVQKQMIDATYQLGWRLDTAKNKEYTFFNGTVSFSDRGDFESTSEDGSKMYKRWDVGDTITFRTADEIGAMARHGAKGEFETLVPGAKVPEVPLPEKASSLRGGGYFLGVGVPVIGLHTIGDRRFITGESSIGVGLKAFYPSGKSIIQKERTFKERLWVEISATASDADEEMGKKHEPGDIDEQQMEAQVKRWMEQLQRGRVEDMRKEVEKFSADAVKQAGMKEFEGNIYSGSRTWKTQGGEITHTLSWSFTLIQVQDVEAVLIPEDGYEKWLPEGKAKGNEDTPGSTLEVVVDLQRKGKPKEEPEQTAKFKFELLDVSKEKGIAMNWPAKDQAKDTFDLKIDPKENPDLKIASDRQSAESKAGLRSAKVTITSYDYGAYGKLKVTAFLDDGGTVVAHLEKKPEKTELTIPLDENDNHIADAWEDGFALDAVDANSDMDRWPAGDGHLGDGLSLYEEYRGFMIKGTHERTWPTRKDIFIYDKDSLGVRYFSESGLNIHLVDKEEFGVKSESGAKNSLVININHGFAHLGSQHLLMLEHANISRMGLLGYARCEGNKPGVPKNCDPIQVDLVACLKSGLERLRQVIAHELAHGTNVWHHGDTDYLATGVETLNSDGTWSLPMILPGDSMWSIAAPGGKYSGVENCIMRYTGAHFYETPGGPFRWRRMDAGGATKVRGDWYPPSEKPGTIFCDQTEGTGVNDPRGGTLPDGRKLPKAGNATKGKCKQQFCVNDMKH